MNTFNVNEAIIKSTKHVCDLSISRLFIQNDTRFVWFILVPRIESVTELFELCESDQQQLMREISMVSRFLKDEIGVYKVNIGALGNIVSQLHIHVIGRNVGDSAWPGPVWGQGNAIHYIDEEIQNYCDKFNHWLLHRT